MRGAALFESGKHAKEALRVWVNATGHQQGLSLWGVALAVDAL